MGIHRDNLLSTLSDLSIYPTPALKNQLNILYFSHKQLIENDNFGVAVGIVAPSA